MTTDDTKGLPHIVLLESAHRVAVQEFEGVDSMERAHEYAQTMMLSGAYDRITVAVRVRRLSYLRAKVPVDTTTTASVVHIAPSNEIHH